MMKAYLTMLLTMATLIATYAQTVEISNVIVQNGNNGSMVVDVSLKSNYGFDIISVSSVAAQNKVEIAVCYVPYVTTVLTRKDTIVNVIPSLGFDNYEIKVRAVKSATVSYCTPQTVTDSSTSIFTIAGLAQNSSKTSLQVIPNPASRFVAIEALGHISQITAIQLLDLNGRQIRSYAAHQRKLNICGIEAGLYIIRIQTKEAIISRKLIIE